MQRTLTITIADDVYVALREQVGCSNVSGFIEALLRSTMLRDAALEADYRQAADDEEAEAEAGDWIEASVDEALV